MRSEFLIRRAFRFAVVAALLVVFVPALRAQWFSESRRDEKLQPERVLNAVGVRAGMQIGEVGAGRGYFTLKLARRVGPSGHVWANDISESALERLDERCEDEEFGNVTTVLGKVVEPGLPAGGLDMVFMVYALHDFDRPVELLVNLKKSLKPDAKVVVLDEDAGITGDDHFLSRAEVESLFIRAGYRLIQNETFLDDDLLCCFRAHPPKELTGGGNQGGVSGHSLIARSEISFAKW